MELKNARMDQMKKGVKMVSFYVSLLLSSSSNLIFLEWLSLSWLYQRESLARGEGVYSLIWPVPGFNAGQGMVFDLSVSCTGYIISSESVRLHDLY